MKQIPQLPNIRLVQTKSKARPKHNNSLIAIDVNLDIILTTIVLNCIIG